MMTRNILILLAILLVVYHLSTGTEQFCGGSCGAVQF